MRSSRRRRDPAQLTFFIDRGLGKHHVPSVFEAAGLSVVRMADAFPADGQFVGDDDWIQRASDEGWVALTKDTAIVRDHTDVLARSTVRVFALPSANLTGRRWRNGSRSTCTGSSSGRRSRGRSST